MKKLFIAAVVLGSIFSAISCSSLKKSTQSARDFQLRSYQEETLANGLKIIFIDDSALPKISLNLLVKVGALNDPSSLEGLNLMTAGLLDQGTATRSATQLADEFAQLGTQVSQSGDYDYSTVVTHGLATSKEKLLELFTDVVMNPSFQGKEIERVKAETTAALKQMVDNPGGYADLKMNEVLFASHPYALPTMGTEASVKKIRQADVNRHYLRYYRPNNSILAVTGQLTNEFRKKVKDAFAVWQYQEVNSPSRITPADSEGAPILLVSKAGLKQTQIRWGQLGIRRSDPAYMKLRLANIVLGGAFASRLNQKVRDDLGLTYSISSHFDARQDLGSFEISTFTRNEKVGETIRATQNVIKEFRKGITSKELAAAKAYLVGQFPAVVETSDRLASNLMILRYYGVPDTYLSDFFKNVNSISLSDVNSIIDQYIQPQKMKVLVYADQEKVVSQIKELGPFSVKTVQ